MAMPDTADSEVKVQRKQLWTVISDLFLPAKYSLMLKSKQGRAGWSWKIPHQTVIYLWKDKNQDFFFSSVGKMLSYFIFALLIHGFSAGKVCISDNLKRCLHKNEVGIYSLFMTAGDPCFKYQGGRVSSWFLLNEYQGCSWYYLHPSLVVFCVTRSCASLHLYSGMWMPRQWLWSNGIVSPAAADGAKQR